MKFLILFVMAAFCLFVQIFCERRRPKYPAQSRDGIIWITPYGSVSQELEKGWPKHWYPDYEEPKTEIDDPFRR